MDRIPLFREKLLVWKRDGVLVGVDLGGYETRNESVLRLIGAADDTHEIPDFPPVMVHTGDRPINTGEGWCCLSFSTAEGYADVPVPDFVFDAWPQSGLADYAASTEAIALAGALPAQRERLGWIGNCDTHPIRWTLHGLGREHPELLEIDHVAWVPGSEDSSRLQTAGRLETEQGNYLSLEEQIRRWGVLLDVEGNGLSGRLKLLLHSGRPLLVAERPWQEWYMHELVPMEHFIPVRRDLSDLLTQLEWVRSHPGEARRIGRAGQAFAQARLRREDAHARWAEVLTAVAERCAAHYAPTPWRELLDPVIEQCAAGAATSLTHA